MAKSSLNSSVIIKRKITDLSTQSLFKKFIIRYLIGFVVLSVLFIFTVSKFSQMYCDENINSIINETALNIMNEQTSSINASQKSSIVQYKLASAHEKLNSNIAINDSAFILFDLTNQKAISSSLAVATYNDNSLLDWYKEQKENATFIETSLPDSLIEFYDTHRNVYIKTASFLNGLLIPEEVGLKTNPDIMYTEMKRADEHRALYDGSIDFRIIGNRKYDQTFLTATNYAIRVLDPETKEIVVLYDNIPDNCKIESRQFTINDNQYQLTVVYEYDLISSIILYIVVVELILCGLSVLLSYLRVKEHQNQYN